MNWSSQASAPSSASAPSPGSALPRRQARSIRLPIRGLSYHAWVWGEHCPVTPERPPLVLAHGWMDVGASFQFLVDAFATERRVVALDWRGFGGSVAHSGTDTYYFPDYLADLDALLRAPELGLADEPVIDLCGHSMGGNVVMLYAGARPQRIRRLINLEGFGLPARRAEEAPRHTARWLDELREPARMRSYPSVEAVAERLRLNNPRLTAERAAWLAPHWAQPQADGQWHILGDPAHKHANPVLYRVEEVLASWRAISAPTLWVEGRQTDVRKWWGDRYPRAEFESRILAVPQLQRETLDDCGHMLHHDQPERLADIIERFLA